MKRFKKIVAAVTATASLLALNPGVSVFAEKSYTQVTSGGITYELYNKNEPNNGNPKHAKVVTINSDVTSANIKSYIEFKDTYFAVTELGDAALKNCKNLKSISIPAELTDGIEQENFSACKSLESVNVSDENIEYSSDNGVLLNKKQTEIILVPQAKSGSYTVPDTVTSLAGDAKNSEDNEDLGDFANCTKLTSVKLGKGLNEIATNAFRNAISLKSVVIPEGVKKINRHAFLDCSSLKDIQLPNSIEYIDETSFSRTPLRENQTGIMYADNWIIGATVDVSNVKIKNGTVGIASGAFSYCSKISSITIPASVKYINWGAFDNCTALKEIKILNPKCVINDAIDTIPETTKIVGYKNSTAQRHAEKWDYNFEEYDDEPQTTEKPTITTTTTTTATTITTTTTVKTTETTKALTTTKKTTTTTAPSTDPTESTTPTTSTTRDPNNAPIILGDVDDSGRVDAADATSILIAYAEALNNSSGGVVSGNIALDIADVDKDKRVTSSDATCVLIYYASYLNDDSVANIPIDVYLESLHNKNTDPSETTTTVTDITNTTEKPTETTSTTTTTEIKKTTAPTTTDERVTADSIVIKGSDGKTYIIYL